ncbi:MAG TPA: hypothetical protein VMW85_08315 [Methanomassiliicoccales archaeon]|nr:hypothetical protein [Methanomassiliicoccales archaeon]
MKRAVGKNVLGRHDPGPEKDRPPGAQALHLMEMNLGGLHAPSQMIMA